MFLILEVHKKGLRDFEWWRVGNWFEELRRSWSPRKASSWIESGNVVGTTPPIFWFSLDTWRNSSGISPTHTIFFFLILSFNILQFLFPWNFFYSNGSVAKQCWCCCDFRRFLHDPFYILITAVNKIWIFFIHHHLFLLVVATVQRWFNPHLLKPKGFSLSLSKGSEKMSESFSVQREKTGNILFFLFQLLTAGGWSRGYLGAF